jgi:hypothetical protein
VSDETAAPTPRPVDDQAAVDAADAAAGYRAVVDEEEVTALPASDPNVAAGDGDFDHENHIGDELDHDPLADRAV